MAEAIIADWIADYSGLQESELRTFAAQHENDFEISKALYSILNERTKYKDVSSIRVILTFVTQPLLICFDVLLHAAHPSHLQSAVQFLSLE